MTIASLERRLRKVEIARRPPRGLFFVAWGATAEEIERGVEEARRTGIVATGEPVVRVPWPFGGARPPNRWARDEISHFTHTEFTAPMGPVDELLDRIAENTRAELRGRGIDVDQLLKEDPPERRKTATDDLPDGVHLRTVLAEPLDSDPDPVPEARFRRIVDGICTLSFRACIRGCDHARDQLVEAAYAAKH